MLYSLLQNIVGGDFISLRRLLLDGLMGFWIFCLDIWSLINISIRTISNFHFHFRNMNSLLVGLFTALNGNLVGILCNFRMRFELDLHEYYNK